MRPISLLRLYLLRFVDQDFPGNSREFPPFKIKIMLESNPPKSRILVLKLAVALHGVGLAKE